MKRSLALSGFLSVLALACSSHSGSESGAAASSAASSSAGPVITSFFYTPSDGGQQPVVDAINGAQSSIRMMMFHLTVQPVVDALVAAAKRGVDVELILDRGNYDSHTPAAIKSDLTGAGIKVIESSPAFQITHVKTLVIDKSEALIMSLNLTSPYKTTRDYAVVTTDSGIISEFLSVFDGDVVNAQNGTKNTPKLHSPYLAWSPVDSESRLVSFIQGAKSTLDVTTENLGDAAIEKALEQAASQGVTVRLITPLCDQNANPLFDLPHLAELAAAGVQAHAMPAPASGSTPYMHAKLMIADDARAYVGSINLSTNSTQAARELGIFFNNQSAIGAFEDIFEQDWGQSVVPPPESGANCPSVSAAGAGLTSRAAGPTPPDDDDGAESAPSCDALDDGFYCGNDGLDNGDADTLYQCVGGYVYTEELCSSDCSSSGSGMDSCQADGDDGDGGAGDDGAAGCGALADGSYCGSDGIANGDPNTLYQCAGGMISPVVVCTNGCAVDDGGTGNDSCE